MNESSGWNNFNLNTPENLDEKLWELLHWYCPSPDSVSVGDIPHRLTGCDKQAPSLSSQDKDAAVSLTLHLLPLIVISKLSGRHSWTRNELGVVRKISESSGLMIVRSTLAGAKRRYIPHTVRQSVGQSVLRSISFLTSCLVLWPIQLIKALGAVYMALNFSGMSHLLGTCSVLCT